MATTNANPTFADGGTLFNETTRLLEGGLWEMHLGILTVTTAAAAARDTVAARDPGAQLHHHAFGHMRG